MKHVKLFEDFNSEYDYKEVFVKISDKYSLVLWTDMDDDNQKCVSITTNSNLENPEDDMIAFAVEDLDDNRKVVIMDHGLVVGQILSDEEKKALSDVGIKIGDEYDDMNDFWDLINKIKTK